MTDFNLYDLSTWPTDQRELVRQIVNWSPVCSGQGNSMFYSGIRDASGIYANSGFSTGQSHFKILE